MMIGQLQEGTVTLAGDDRKEPAHLVLGEKGDRREGWGGLVRLHESDSRVLMATILRLPYTTAIRLSLRGGLLYGLPCLCPIAACTLLPQCAKSTMYHALPAGLAARHYADTTLSAVVTPLNASPKQAQTFAPVFSPCPRPALAPLCVAYGAHGARPAWRSPALSPAAGVRVRLGRAPGDTGEVRGGAGGWARVKSGFIFPILRLSPTMVYGGWQGEEVTSDSQIYIVLAAKRPSSLGSE